MTHESASPQRLPLREEHRATTRRRILGALVELLAIEHPAAISIPAVAARAGVSPATLYRYFPTKEALLDAAATFGYELIGSPVGEGVPEFDSCSARDSLVEMWRSVLEYRGVVFAQHWSEAGRDLRRRRANVRRRILSDGLRARGVDPASPSGRRALELVMVLISSSALLEFHDREGVSIDDAAGYVAWAIDAIVAATLNGVEQQYGDGTHDRDR